MRRILSYLSALLVMFMSLSCSREAKVIPRGKMVLIYADMFLLDELINDQRLYVIADTTRVYESVFNKYGYTSEDYLASQEKYIRDADRYNRMLKKAVHMLETEMKGMKAEKARIDAALNALQRVRMFKPNRIYLYEDVGLDSLMSFDSQQGLDTIYRGPLMIVAADSLLNKSDSLLNKSDSLLNKADSLMVDKMRTIRSNRLVTTRIDKSGD